MESRTPGPPREGGEREEQYSRLRIAEQHQDRHDDRGAATRHRTSGGRESRGRATVHRGPRVGAAAGSGTRPDTGRTAAAAGARPHTLQVHPRPRPAPPTAGESPPRTALSTARFTPSKPTTWNRPAGPGRVMPGRTPMRPTTGTIRRSRRASAFSRLPSRACYHPATACFCSEMRAGGSSPSCSASANGCGGGRRGSPGRGRRRAGAGAGGQRLGPAARDRPARIAQRASAGRGRARGCQTRSPVTLAPPVIAGSRVISNRRSPVRSTSAWGRRDQVTGRRVKCVILTHG